MIDYHVHSNFSADSDAAIDDICKSAIENGLTEIALTDHIDIDYPYSEIQFDFDAEKRIIEIEKYRQKYTNLNILNGIELGVTKETKGKNVEYLNKNTFDYIIASVHTVDKVDPYYKEFFENRTIEQALTTYLKEILECTKDFSEYNVVGHIGYPARFIEKEHNAIEYKDYMDIVDEILKSIISNNKGIEINTKGIASTGDTLPAKSIVKRYKQLGGEIITIGSDAHVPKRVGDCVKETYEFLSSIGYKYITKFKHAKPYFEKI